MGFVEGDFGNGVVSAQGILAAERARQWDASQRARKMMLHRNKDNKAEFQALLDETESLPPLWQRICGFSAREEVLIEPGERRAGIRRLLRVVERMFRAEIRTEDIDADGGPSKLDGGEVSFAGRSQVWEPLNEICLYLGISKPKLNAMSVQRTGLRAIDLCDCIRTEGIRAVLRERFRELVRTWISGLEDSEGPNGYLDDSTNAAWRFLKWMRGGGRGATRKKLAFELGLPSRERLDRAVLVCEGETLEELEIEVAVQAIEEFATPKPRVARDMSFLRDVLGSHGAGCDEVDEKGPNEERKPGEDEKESA